MKKHEFGRQGVYQESQDDDDDYASYGGYDYGAEEGSEDEEED